jgi:hypothetical protein
MICTALVSGLALVGVASEASAQAGPARTVTNKTGMSFAITPYDDGLRRHKYVAWDASINRPYWYSQTGSANRGRGESGQWTSPQQWCRVRYLYNDSVRIPECWGSFMYSSHLITGLDGDHYELWFSPSSLSYYKIRNQTKDTWYAHDGSANAGHSGISTSKDDWCRVIIYQMNGIVKIPQACQGLLEKILKVSAGVATPSEESAELQAMRKTLGLADFAAGSMKVAGGALKVSGTGIAGGIVGVPVSYGTEAMKDALGLRAKNENAGAIAAEVMTTTAVNAGVTTLIMTAAGASFNPVSAGVGLLVAGSIAGGEALYAASEDTGIVMQPGYGNHPRYNLDLNGIISYNKPHLPLASKVTDGGLAPSGAVNWSMVGSTLASDVGDGWALTKTETGAGWSIVKLNAEGTDWEAVGGAAARIGGTRDEPWVATGSGTAFRWNGSDWEHTPGKFASDVGQGWIISNEPTGGGFKIYRYNRSTRAWDNIPGGAVRVGGTYENAWVVNDGGAVFEYVNNGWQHRQGVSALDVGHGWVLSKTDGDSNGQSILQYNSATQAWVTAPGRASSIGGSYSRPMVSNTGGAIFKTN